jgi:integrase
MGQIRCSSCGKSSWTSKGVCGNCGNPHARIDLWYAGKTHYYFQNNEGGSLDYQTAKALLGSIQTELDNSRKRGIQFDPTKWKERERKTIGKKLDEWVEHKEIALSRGRLHPSSILAIRSHLRGYILPFFGTILEEDLSKSLLSNFLDHLPQSLKRKTRINIYTTLKSFIKWAGYTIQLPTIDEDDDSAERVALTIEEQYEALQRIPARHRDIIEFAMETGLRTGEVCVLMPIDLTPRNTIWVRRTLSGDQIIETTKAGSRIELALSDRALEIARKHIGGAFLFINEKTGDRYSPNTLGVIWRKHSGIDVTLYEATRHSFISQLVDSGASSLQTRTLARHSSVKTTQRYYHGNRTTLRDVLNRRGKVIEMVKEDMK